MNERDMLYQTLRMAEEKRKRDNFNAFMDAFDGGLRMDLDKAYASGDTQRYERLLNNVKAEGIRVFRNSEGKHKLKYIS